MATEVFTTRPVPLLIDCLQPEVTVSFPAAVPRGPAVVLANGAVVDLIELGRIISLLCPALVCPEPLFLPSPVIGAPAVPSPLLGSPVLQTPAVVGSLDP